MRWGGWWLGPLLGCVSAFAVHALLRELWGYCRYGINASARGFELVFGDVPRTFLVTAVLAGIVYAALYRIPVRGRIAVALAGAVVVVIAVVLMTVYVRHNPYHDGTTCVPPWFPTWIPLKES